MSTDIKPLLYSIPAAGKLIGLGRTKIYELISAGRLDAKKAGYKTLVTSESIARYVESLPKAEIHIASCMQ